MTALYLFAAAVGVPLVLWFLLSGAEDGGDGGDGGDGDSGVGGIMLRLFPLSTIALAAAVFGLTGLALGAAGTASTTTVVGAAAVALVAGALNSTVFAYLRRSGSTTEVSDERLVGTIGRVVLPVGVDRRGRIAVSVGDQQLYLSAQSLPGADPTDELEPGDPILVVDVRGGIAAVTRLDPELT